MNRKKTTSARDPRCGPVPDEAWERDTETRRRTGRVEIFNATAPGGLDGWTVDADQHQTVHDIILEIIDDDPDPDGTIALQHVVDTIQDRPGTSDLFPNGRLTNYVRYTKTDMDGSPLRNRSHPTLHPATHHPPEDHAMNRLQSKVSRTAGQVGAVMCSPEALAR